MLRRWELADAVLVGVVLAIAAALVLSAACFGLGTLAMIRTGRLPLRAALPATDRPTAQLPATESPTAVLTRAPYTPTPGTTATPLWPTSTPTPSAAALPSPSATVTWPTYTPQPTGTTAEWMTDTPQPSDTPTGPAETPSPTSTPTPQPGGARLIIVEVNKVYEWVRIRNAGTTSQFLEGWIIVSENGYAVCRLPAVFLDADDQLRIWTRAGDVQAGDATCNLTTEMWSDFEVDPAVLYDPQGQEVDREPPR